MRKNKFSLRKVTCLTIQPLPVTGSHISYINFRIVFTLWHLIRVQINITIMKDTAKFLNRCFQTCTGRSNVYRESHWLAKCLARLFRHHFNSTTVRVQVEATECGRKYGKFSRCGGSTRESIFALETFGW